jgi:hypothetical protein
MVVEMLPFFALIINVVTYIPTIGKDVLMKRNQFLREPEWFLKLGSRTGTNSSH